MGWVFAIAIGRTNFGELGLQYFRNRFYSPDLGRFISSDPLGMVDGPNTYGFCGGDPVNATDPMGTCWETVGVSLASSARGIGRRWNYGCGKPLHQFGPEIAEAGEARVQE